MSKWTKEMEAVMRSASPISFESAEQLASELSVSKRSVIAKAKQMGLDYVPKAKAVSTRDTGPTKVQIVSGIRELLSVPAREGDLTKDELLAIFTALS